MKRVGWTLSTMGSAAVAIAALVLPARGAAGGEAPVGETITIPAVSFSAQGGGEASRVESLNRPGREYVHFWYTTGHYIEWTIDCPKAGDYGVVLRCAAKLPAKRSLSFNGRPVVGLESFTIQPTSKGRWRDGWAQWSEVALRVPLKLARGRSTLRMTCLDDTSIRLSGIVLTAQDGTALEIRAAQFSAEGGGHVQTINPPVLGAVGSEWRKAWHQAGHWVEWNVEVPFAGRYAMGFHYRADGYCRLELQVNGERIEGLTDFILPKTGDLAAYTIGTLPKPVTLKQGRNVLRMTTQGEWTRAEVIFNGMLALSAIHLTPLADNSLPDGNLLSITTMDEILASLPKHEETISPAPLGPALPEVDGALALKEGEGSRVADRQAVIVKADVLPYVENEHTRASLWVPFGDPKLKTIRGTYKLDEVVAPGKTEFEKQRLLMRWVWDQWDFGHAQELYNLTDPLWILRETRKEHVFQCMHSASVMMPTMASLGWVARRCSSSNHTWNEVWSNQYGRWVFMDATHNQWHERNGIPLSSYEWHHGRYVEQTDQIVTHARDDAIWHLDPKPRSFRMGVHGTNSYGASRAPERSVRFVIAEDAVNDVDPKDLYYPINQAALALVPDGDGLRVTLGTITPNFKEFRIRVEGGEWQALQGTTFAWRLNPGENRLEARSVNLFDVEGNPSVVVVRMD